MRIQIKSGRGAKGDSARMMGVNLQNAGITDFAGNRIDQSSLSDEFIGLYKNFIRKPNGSESYHIKNVNDPDMQILMSEMFPEMPEYVGHDITWPPQLPTESIYEWVTPRLKRIAVFNEPPMHTGPGKEFQSVSQCVNMMEDVYDKLRDLQPIMFFHSGKPEVLDLPDISEKGKRMHREYLDYMGAAVKHGKLPARIATTHKLEPGYGADKTAFYNKLITQYQGYFGQDVELLFHEYKYARSENDSLLQVQLVMEFLLAMSRIIYERPGSVAGGSFQTISGPGTTNIFGLDKPQRPQWQTGGMYNLWTLIHEIMVDGLYVESVITDRPAEVQAEVFLVDNNFRLLFNNFSNSDVRLQLPANTMRYIDSSLTVKEQSYTRHLPAKTAGVLYA